jgi:small ligand-binding sensory domain FIST
MVGMAESSRFAFASSLSTEPNSALAWKSVTDAALSTLGTTAHLAVVFFSHHHLAELPSVVDELRKRLGDQCLILGCTGESIIGQTKEVEGDPAVSLWLASLPQVALAACHVDFHRTVEGMAIAGWTPEFNDPWPEDSFLIALAEPFSFPADVLLEQLHEDRPALRVIGGMASGAHRPGQNCLLLNNEIHHEGAVLLRISGGIRLRTIVSQGCRPIGKPFVITKAERNVIFSLGGKSALSQLQEIFATLPTREQAIARQGLHLGRVVNEYLEHFSQGDFLVRNVTGIDPNSQAIAVGDYFRVGQTVQFHIRDHESADAELKQLLAPLRDEPNALSRGALLFTCNGRGTRLFPEPDHDAGVIHNMLGDLPIAGLFAQGEIGPVGNQNFLHGFTACLGILEEV